MRALDTKIPALGGNSLFLCFFVWCSLSAPITKLLELNFAFNFFLVLFGPVVYPFAFGTGEFYKTLL